jgi:hypothetical protein
MKAKLIKTEVNYLLENKEGIIIASTSLNKEGKSLSKQNCDEIFGVVDVEKYISEDSFDKIIYSNSYKQGFNKAMELNKNNVFTLEDIRKAYYVGYEDGKSGATFFQQLIQSLNQPTEIEVMIVMESTLVGQCDCPCHKEGVKMMHSMACCNPKRIEQPKLDSSGNLILKKI